MIWEQCDDGNLVSGDGCSSSCVIEEFNSCTNAIASKNFCEFYCGDSYVQVSEECDDGNNIDGDGCSALDCTIEPMYICNNKVPNVCIN